MKKTNMTCNNVHIVLVSLFFVYITNEIEFAIQVLHGLTLSHNVFVFLYLTNGIKFALQVLHEYIPCTYL